MESITLKWKALSDWRLELRASTGGCLASVTEGESGLWCWYFRIPDKFSNGGNPTGAAISREAAKGVCDAIVASFGPLNAKTMGLVAKLPRIKSDSPVRSKSTRAKRRTSPAESSDQARSLTRIPFKHGGRVSVPRRMELEEELSFEFPLDFLNSYGDWNGGSVDGYVLFDTPAGKLAVTKFLSLSVPQAGQDEFEESVLTIAGHSPFLRRFSAAKMPFIPFAVVDFTVVDEGDHQPCNSTLAFERKTRHIFLLSMVEDKATPIQVAKSWNQLAAFGVFVFEG